MSYLTKSYLQTQFKNFEQKILGVFAKKKDVPIKTSQLENDKKFVTADGSVKYAESAGTAANASKVANALTFTGGATGSYDGSKPFEVEIPKGSVDILSTTEEVEANTESGKYVADALVTKNIIINAPEWIFNEDGSIKAYKTKVGADTEFPFKEKTKIYLEANAEYNQYSQARMMIPTRLYTRCVVHFSTDFVISNASFYRVGVNARTNYQYTSKPTNDIEYDLSGLEYVEIILWIHGNDVSANRYCRMKVTFFN